MTNRFRVLLGSVALAALMPVAALADEDIYTTGPYLGIAGGGSFPLSSDFGGTVSGKADFNPGWAAFAEGGWGFGNGFRAEVEGGWIHNGVSGIEGGGSGSGHSRLRTLLVNALYDFDTGTAFVPHVGAGLGLANMSFRNLGSLEGNTVSGTENVLGYQAIVGFDYAVAPQLKLGFDYRFIGAGTAGFDTSPAVGRGNAEFMTNVLTVGLRWDLAPPPPAPVPSVTPPPPPPPPAPPPAAAPEAKRSFQVFFDFDKSNITDAAARVIQSAADAVKTGHVVSIMVTGHTDTVGSAAYNQGLSERRAAAVKMALVADGVSGGEISTVGVGKTGLLVPTADGVREPQNRRAEIVLQ
jgi:outer membrane protein OmpA-like peptidoglycan-associated protein